MSNLRLINETEITSTVTSVNVTDVFSADFDIYKIVLDGVQESAVGQHQWVRMRFINSSGSIITSNYDYAQLRMLSNSAFGEERQTNSVDLLYAGLGYSDDYGTNAVAYIFNPFSSSSYTFELAQGIFWNGTIMQTVKGIGVNKQTTSVTGFNLYQSSGSMGSGFIRTYGLRVDS